MIYYAKTAQVGATVCLTNLNFRNMQQDKVLILLSPKQSQQCFTETTPTTGYR
jgi:hypothetical protein